jgi:hypothetical protein
MHQGYADHVHLSQDLKDNRYWLAKLQQSLRCPCTTHNYGQASGALVQLQITAKPPVSLYRSNASCLYFLHKVGTEEIMSACEIKSEEI